MNPNTIYNALESSARPRLHSWMQSHRKDIEEVVAEAKEELDVPALHAQWNRMREQAEIAQERARSKRLKRMEADRLLGEAQQEFARVQAAWRLEQQVLEQLRVQSLRSAFSSSTGPSMAPEGIAAIRRALQPDASASEAERTRATQTLNAFIDRLRRNPGRAAELKSQIEYLKRDIEDAEATADHEMKAEGEARLALDRVKRTIEYHTGALEVLRRQIEELRRKVGASPAAGGAMTPEEMKLLRFALHPDRKPGADELRKASAAFEAYLSRSGSGRATDTRADDDARRAREAAAERQARAEETIRKAKEAARQREADEAREREWEKDRARYREKNESDAQKRHTRDADQYKRAVQDRAADGNFRIGDILCASWGYSMTLVDFYYVEGRRGKSTVILIPLDGTIVDGDGWSGHKVPSEYRKRGPGDSPLTARATVKGDSISVKVNNGARAYLWDGKPKYFNTMD